MMQLMQSCNLGHDIVCYMVSNFKCLVYYVFTFLKKKPQIAFISQAKNATDRETIILRRWQTTHMI